VAATGNHARGVLAVRHASSVITPSRRWVAPGIAALAGAVCLLALGACGSSSDKSAAPATPSSASPAAPPAPSPSETPRLGKAVQLQTGEYKSTAAVFAFRQPLSSRFPPDDWFSVPLFPGAGFEKTLRPGRCVRGWVLFEVPKGKRPSLAEYAPTDLDGERITYGPSWKL
jgi:hypothetical protein